MYGSFFDFSMRFGRTSSDCFFKEVAHASGHVFDLQLVWMNATNDDSSLKQLCAYSYPISGAR